MNTNLTRFRLGHWQVDCQLGTLSSEHSRKRLPPKLMGLLQELARSPGELVSRGTLLETVWDGVAVNEEAVSRAIAELRQALGDDARQPRFIETIPKRGYRLMQAVEPVSGTNWSSKWPVLIGLVGLLITLLVIILKDGWWFKNTMELSFDEMRAKPITSDEGREMDPAISNDGQLIVYSQAVVDGQSDLWLVDTLNLMRRQLTDDPHFETSPVFSADAKQVAYLQHDEGSCSVVLYSLFDSSSHRIAACHPGLTGLDWSSDGKEMVFLTQTESGVAITRLNLTDRSTRIVTTNNSGGSTDQHPKYSSDGRWINFVRGTSAQRELYRIPVSGGDAVNLTTDGRYVSGHAWLGPDVVFSSDRMGRRQLWHLNTSSEHITSLGMRGASLVSTSHDGTKLAFESAHYTANIYRLNLDEPGLEAERVISSRDYDNYPALSPAGDLLAYNSNRSGIDSIWLASDNGEQALMILNEPGSRFADPSWSADGKSLLVTRFTQANGQILQYFLESAQTRVLTGAGEHAYGARFADKWIYFIDQGDPGPRLARIRGFGQGPAEILDIGANRVLAGANGFVYYTKPARVGIFVWNPASGEETKVVPDLAVERWKDWALKAPWLVHIRRGAGGVYEVVRTQLENNTPEIVTTFSPNTVGGSIDVSADGKVLFIARTDRAELNIKMIDLSK